MPDPWFSQKASFLFVIGNTEGWTSFCCAGAISGAVLTTGIVKSATLQAASRKLQAL